VKLHAGEVRVGRAGIAAIHSHENFAAILAQRRLAPLHTQPCALSRERRATPPITASGNVIKCSRSESIRVEGANMQAEEAHSQLATLDADLAAFEQQYAISSNEFLHSYEAGQTDDRMDFVEWASLLRMRENLLRRLHLLTGENAA
jgi:hypothetical protein